MVRLVVALVVLVIVLIARLIYWLVEKAAAPPSVHMQRYNFGPRGGQHPGGGYGTPGLSQPGAGAQGWAQQGAGWSPPGGGWPQQGAPGLPAAGTVRLVARPECGFDRVSDCMARAGLRVAVPPGPAVQPGE